MSEREPIYKVRWPSLTKVLHEVVKSRPHGLDVETIGELVGKPYNTLMSELGRQPGHKLDADLVLPLCDIVGPKMPMDFLARRLGGSFVLLPDASACPDAALVQTLADSVKEFGEFAAETASSIADGDIPLGQLSRIDKEGHEAIESIMAMMRLARQTHEKQYGNK